MLFVVTTRSEPTCCGTESAQARCHWQQAEVPRAVCDASVCRLPCAGVCMKPCVTQGLGAAACWRPRLHMDQL